MNIAWKIASIAATYAVDWLTEEDNFKMLADEVSDLVQGAKR